MPRVLTILEASVPQARHADLQAAYRSAAHETFPPGLVRSTLLQATNDRTLWRIETLWKSREALDAMRGTGTTRGLLIFRAASAEPTLTVFDIQDELLPPQGAA
jgi:antibiotic biosynthesis monooxygenase